MALQAAVPIAQADPHTPVDSELSQSTLRIERGHHRIVACGPAKARTPAVPVPVPGTTGKQTGAPLYASSAPKPARPDRDRTLAASQQGQAELSHPSANSPAATPKSALAATHAVLPDSTGDSGAHTALPLQVTFDRAGHFGPRQADLRQAGTNTPPAAAASLARSNVNTVASIPAPALPAGQFVTPVASAEDSPAPLLQTLQEKTGVKVNIATRAQAFVAHSNLMEQQPFNYLNQYARLPVTEFNTELRPQIELAYGPVDILVKPRVRFQWDRVDYGRNAGLNTNSEKGEVFLLEGRARWALWDRLFLSFGREALLWGPAMYITPSNPFFVTNNRSNPYREIRGREYAKATYVFNNQWTASFFSNVGLGLDTLVDQPKFQRTDAIKLDYTGTWTNAALILSRRDDGFKRIGGYFQWTTSDALLLYADGNVSFGTDVLYPTRSTAAEGWDFAKRGGSDPEGIALLGASYTAPFGPTLTAEYIYNSQGYGSRDAANYYQEAAALSQALPMGGSIAARAAALLNQAQAPGLSLLRRHYLFLQLLETNIADQVDLTIRYTHNLDDGGSELVPILDWSVGSSTHLFALAQITMGSNTTEARRYVDNQVFMGVNYTFDW